MTRTALPGPVSLSSESLDVRVGLGTQTEPPPPRSSTHRMPAEGALPRWKVCDLGQED